MPVWCVKYVANLALYQPFLITVLYTQESLFYNALALIYYVSLSLI